MHSTILHRGVVIAAFIALAASAMLLAACGGGTSSGDKTATAAAGAVQPTPVSTKAPATPASSPTSGSAGGSATVSVATSGDPRFVDSAGLTLYEFQKDTANSGTSACTGGCATNWPPLTVPAGTTPTGGEGVDGLGVITRDDGSMQVTYDGMPLYHFATDKAPGDENGKAIPNWMLAVP